VPFVLALPAVVVGEVVVSVAPPNFVSNHFEMQAPWVAALRANAFSQISIS
jgi:hypothetical protein